MDSLEGKVAVVTGAASGIGLALSQALAAHHAHVVMADVDPGRLAAAARMVDGALAIPTDVSSAASVLVLATRTRERHGAVHLLCNNAGVQRAGRVWTVPPNDFECLVRVNLLGAFHGIHAFVAAMLERGEPAHVVNTASISGLLGFPLIGPYAATKYGVLGLSESLRFDLADRNAPIGVSVLCPGTVATDLARNRASLRGATATDMEPSGIDPSEIAGAVIDAVKEGRFWILTHPAYEPMLEQRLQWMRGSAEPPPAPGFFE